MKKIKRTEKGFILAEGEMTGHAHRTNGAITLFEDAGERFIETQTPFVVEHEEHKAVTIPFINTKIKIGKVQEYDHFREEARKVAD